MQRNLGAIAAPAILLVIVSAPGAGAGEAAHTALTPAQALTRLASAPRYHADWFTDTMRTAAGPNKIHAILAGMTAQLGAFQKVRGHKNPYALQYTLGTVPVRIYLDAAGRISGLWFGTPAPSSKAAASALLHSTVKTIESGPGRVGLLMTRNGKVLVSHNADTPLAVGSAFKLAIMAALKHAYTSGAQHPATVVELEAGDKALPSGIMQNWPVGTPVTLATAATLMISLSDNTAADLLMRVLGRGAVDTLVPARDRPYLTTREAFTLKAAANAAEATAWKAASTTAARRRVLTKVDALPLPTLDDLPATEPAEPAIEWFYTPRELCAQIAAVADMPAMGVNPQTDAKSWKRVAYKGGSEAGVLDLTYWLEAKDGTRYCVTATWNAAHTLKEPELVGLAKRLVSVLPH